MKQPLKLIIEQYPPPPELNNQILTWRDTNRTIISGHEQLAQTAKETLLFHLDIMSHYHKCNISFSRKKLTAWSSLKKTSSGHVRLDK